MKLNTSYRQIVSISLPIMLGSATQNVIALSDSVFLYHVSEVDFASIGFVGIFYMIVAAIGYGISRGGQVLIARRAGEEKPAEIGNTFYSMLAFELVVAVVMFLFMQYVCPSFFWYFVESEAIYTKSIEYLEYRSWGVFFSYLGVSMIALYTGVARTTFIIVDTIILAIVNIFFNYTLIYGYWGMPEMGIAGAGLASTLAEIVAFIVFLGYVLWDKEARNYHLFKRPTIDFELIKKQLKVSLPIVAQAFVGLGSWFIFFGIVEKMGERELAITNLVRIVYLILSIPTWGFASGVNTMVSNFIGQQKRQAVVPITWKTAWLNFAITLSITVFVLAFPKITLYPLFGAEDMSLIAEAGPTFWVLGGIIAVFSIGGVFFNSVVGTGATFVALVMQIGCVIFYIAYLYIVVNYTNLGLHWAWSAELAYWVVSMVLCVWYLRSKRWYQMEV